MFAGMHLRLQHRKLRDGNTGMVKGTWGELQGIPAMLKLYLVSCMKWSTPIFLWSLDAFIIGESFHSLNLGFLSCPIFFYPKVFELEGRRWGILPLDSQKPWILYVNFPITFNLYISLLSLSYKSTIFVSTSSEVLLPLNLGMRKDPEWYPGFLLHLLSLWALASLGFLQQALSLTHAARRATDWLVGKYSWASWRAWKSSNWTSERTFSPHPFLKLEI